nr:MAG TPA: hypothetical protein [Caudoviricetes sp.]
MLISAANRHFGCLYISVWKCFVPFLSPFDWKI